ncbi:MAG: hypothetical protein R2839_01795 [Thermomicrobiales bacterium]
MRIQNIDLYLIKLTLRAPFTTSFGTYRELSRPFVVIGTEDGLTGVGEVPTLSDPAYKAEVDPPSVVTSLREFVLPAVARRQNEIGSIGTYSGSASELRLDQGGELRQERCRSRVLDIEAQRRGTSLATFWGGSRTEFPVDVSIGGTNVEDVPLSGEGG